VSDIIINEQQLTTDIGQFFGLFEIPDDHHMLIWTMPDKRSYWVKDHSELIDLVVGLRDKHVYMGVATSLSDRGPYKRVNNPGYL